VFDLGLLGYGEVRSIDGVIKMKLLRKHSTGLSIFALLATLIGVSIAYYVRETKKHKEEVAEQDAFAAREMMRRAS